MTGQSPPVQLVSDKAHHSNGNSTPNGPPSGELAQYHKNDATAAPSASSGQVLLGSNESTYVGATHWAAILEDVRSSQHPLDGN